MFHLMPKRLYAVLLQFKPKYLKMTPTKATKLNFFKGIHQTYWNKCNKSKDFKAKYRFTSKKKNRCLRYLFALTLSKMVSYWLSGGDDLFLCSLITSWSLDHGRPKIKTPDHFLSHDLVPVSQICLITNQKQIHKFLSQIKKW